jgi:hypothetical protein
MNEIKISDYAKIFIVLLKDFGEPSNAMFWLEDYGKLYEENGMIVNAVGLKIIKKEMLDKIKITINDKEW